MPEILVKVAEGGAESMAIVRSHACDSPRTADKADVKVLAIEGTALSSVGESAMSYTVIDVALDLVVPVVVNASCSVNDSKCERRCSGCRLGNVSWNDGRGGYLVEYPSTIALSKRKTKRRCC